MTPHKNLVAFRKITEQVSVIVWNGIVCNGIVWNACAYIIYKYKLQRYMHMMKIYYIALIWNRSSDIFFTKEVK